MSARAYLAGPNDAFEDGTIVLDFGGSDRGISRAEAAELLDCLRNLRANGDI